MIEVQEIRKKEGERNDSSSNFNFSSPPIYKNFFGERDERYLRIRYVLLTFKTTPVQGVTQYVETLRYKAEGREFDLRWCHYKPAVSSLSNRNEYQCVKAACA
jgi:hypothetical protein